MRDGQGRYTFSNPDCKSACFVGSFAGVDIQSVAARDASSSGGDEIKEEDGSAAQNTVVIEAISAVAGYHGGLPHGEGTFVYPDVSFYSGIFLKNIFIRV